MGSFVGQTFFLYFLKIKEKYFSSVTIRGENLINTWMTDETAVTIEKVRFFTNFK